MRLIDADALIDSLVIDPVSCPGCPEMEDLEDFINIIDSAPTVLVQRYCHKCGTRIDGGTWDGA